MKTILASVYAVNPYKGSEDGMGWNFIHQISRFNKVVAITRKNNQQHIEKYMSENPDPVYDNISFLYFDLPSWSRFWKRGSKGAMLYFYLWQRFLPGFVRKQNLHFDIVHNVNFHNDWTPSFLWKLEKPFVWGPIGHHPFIPSNFLKDYKISYFFKDRFTWLVKNIFWKMSPALKKTTKRADHVFCMNKSVANVLELDSDKFSIVPSVATQDFGYIPKQRSDKFTLISAGRLVPLKGFDITIRSFAKFLQNQPEDIKQKCELIIVGSGPELNNYKIIATELGIKNQVNFISWIEREDLMKLFKSSSLFVFPSHEGAGMVVAEALSFGLPVLCLDNCGPGEFINKTCGVSVSYNNYSQTINELSKAISELFNAPALLRKMSENARKHFEEQFHWDVRGEDFRKIYLKL